MKGILFLEQLLEADHERLRKWKHFCTENEINFKGKIPKWFKLIENEVKEEGIGLETWNDINGNPVFGEDKKKVQSKNYKRIGSMYGQVFKNCS
ncbi:hypothetical protein RhiirA4_464147 [Rhizophagus irregularis]|uniref:Uncharacterized protein n=1 Tax=Rhizophagus irregularis TaxID=588596 RepID=A0A2I1GPE9_9GLOM|nr:hypothetical protein RhiirA4_464147 [Rhizophagus irregularis]